MMPRHIHLGPTGSTPAMYCHVDKLLVLSMLFYCRWTSMYTYYLNAMDAIYKVDSSSKTPCQDLDSCQSIYLPQLVCMHQP